MAWENWSKYNDEPQLPAVGGDDENQNYYHGFLAPERAKIANGFKRVGVQRLGALAGGLHGVRASLWDYITGVDSSDAGDSASEAITNYIQNSDTLKPVDYWGDRVGAGRQVVDDVLENGANIVGNTAIMALMSAAPGGAVAGVGSKALMGADVFSQVYGETYSNLVSKGVDPDTASENAAYDALLQAPMEFIGYHGLLGKLGQLGSAGKAAQEGLMKLSKNNKYVAKMLGGAATEAPTEFLQQYPDEYFTNRALGKDTDWGEATKNAAYSAAIGGILGGIGGGLSAKFGGNSENSETIESSEPQSPAMRAMNRLVNAGIGLDANSASGIVGGLMTESGGNTFDISSTAENPSGAYGIAQWLGDRRDQLNAFAVARGSSPSDIDTQIDFIIYELKNGESEALRKIVGAKTPEEAGVLADQYYERSEGTDDIRNAKAQNARAIYDAYMNGGRTAGNIQNMNNGGNEAPPKSARDFLEEIDSKPLTTDEEIEESNRIHDTLKNGSEEDIQNLAEEYGFPKVSNKPVSSEQQTVELPTYQPTQQNAQETQNNASTAIQKPVQKQVPVQEQKPVEVKTPNVQKLKEKKAVPVETPKGNTQPVSNGPTRNRNISLDNNGGVVPQRNSFPQESIGIFNRDTQNQAPSKPVLPQRDNPNSISQNRPSYGNATRQVGVRVSPQTIKKGVKNKYIRNLVKQAFVDGDMSAMKRLSAVNLNQDVLEAVKEDVIPNYKKVTSQEKQAVQPQSDTYTPTYRNREDLNRGMTEGQRNRDTGYVPEANEGKAISRQWNTPQEAMEAGRMADNNTNSYESEPTSRNKKADKDLKSRIRQEKKDERNAEKSAKAREKAQKAEETKAENQKKQEAEEHRRQVEKNGYTPTYRNREDIGRQMSAESGNKSSDVDVNGSDRSMPTKWKTPQEAMEGMRRKEETSTNSEANKDTHTTTKQKRNTQADKDLKEKIQKEKNNESTNNKPQVRELLHRPEENKGGNTKSEQTGKQESTTSEAGKEKQSTVREGDTVTVKGEPGTYTVDVVINKNGTNKPALIIVRGINHHVKPEDVTVVRKSISTGEYKKSAFELAPEYKKKADELQEQFDNGEITADELRDKLQKLAKEFNENVKGELSNAEEGLVRDTNNHISDLKENAEYESNPDKATYEESVELATNMANGDGFDGTLEEAWVELTDSLRETGAAPAEGVWKNPFKGDKLQKGIYNREVARFRKKEAQKARYQKGKKVAKDLYENTKKEIQNVLDGYRKGKGNKDVAGKAITAWRNKLTKDLSENADTKGLKFNKLEQDLNDFIKAKREELKTAKRGEKVETAPIKEEPKPTNEPVEDKTIEASEDEKEYSKVVDQYMGGNFTADEAIKKCTQIFSSKVKTAEDLKNKMDALNLCQNTIAKIRRMEYAKNHKQKGERALKNAEKNRTDKEIADDSKARELLGDELYNKVYRQVVIPLREDPNTRDSAFESALLFSKMSESFKKNYGIDIPLPFISLIKAKRQGNFIVAGNFNRFKNVLHLALGANREFTLLHEGAHWYDFMLRSFSNLSKKEVQMYFGNDIESANRAIKKMKADLKVIDEWAGYSDEKAKEYEGTALMREFAEYSKDAHSSNISKWIDAQIAFRAERFARGFERYLMGGKAPTKELQGVFERFKQWLIGFYRTQMRISNKPLPPEMKRIYDSMINGGATEAVESEGKSTTVRTDDGKEFKATYKIVPADSLISSSTYDFAKNENYPSELQPRDRDRVSMREQVDDMARNLSPQDLAESRNVNEGAPLINQDNVVENGNGRTMAITRAYKHGGEAYNASAKAYKQFLMDNAEKFGYTKEQVEAMENPVLVRQRDSSSDNLQDSIIHSTNGGMKMSASQQARADVKKLTAKTLAKYNYDGSGDLTLESNRDFVTSVLNEVSDKSDRDVLFDKDGKPSKAGIEHVRAVMTAAAYGNTELLDRMSESTDNDMQNIIKAYVSVAPRVASIRMRMENGEIGKDYNLPKVLSDALDFYFKCKAENKPVKFALNETGLFSDGEVTVPNETVGDFVRFMDENVRKPRKISDSIEQMVKYVDGANEGSMSLMPEAQMNLGEIVSASTEEMNQLVPVDKDGKYLVTNRNIIASDPVHIVDITNASRTRVGDKNKTEALLNSLVGQTIEFIGGKGFVSRKDKKAISRVENPNTGKQLIHSHDTDPGIFNSKERNRALTMLDELLHHGVYVDKHPDSAHGTNTKYIEIFVPVRDGNNMYTFRISARERGNSASVYEVGNALFYNMKKERDLTMRPSKGQKASNKSLSTVTIAEMLDGVNDRNKVPYVINGKLNYDDNIFLTNNMLSDEQTTHHSVEEMKAQTMSNFPNAKNVEDTGTHLSFDLPNGEHVEADFTNDTISVNRVKAQQDYGGTLKGDEKALGKLETVGREAFMTLSLDNLDETPSHEAMHLAMKFLTDRERNALFKLYKNEEAICEAYRKWRIGRKARQGALLGKIFQKISDFANKVLSFFRENDKNIFRKVSEGQVWERPINNMAAKHVAYMMDLSNVQEEFEQKFTQQDIKRMAESTMPEDFKRHVGNMVDGYRKYEMPPATVTVNENGDVIDGKPHTTNMTIEKDNRTRAEVVRDRVKTAIKGKNYNNDHITVKERPKDNDWSVKEKVLNNTFSPSRSTDPIMKRLYEAGDTAIKLQQKLKTQWTERLTMARKLIKTDEQKKSINSLLWAEDAEQHVYTDEEMRAEGIDEDTIKAHNIIRRLLGKMYQTINDTYTRATLHTKVFNSREEAEARVKMAQDSPYEEVIGEIREVNHGNSKGYQVTVKSPHSTYHPRVEMTADELKELKADKYNVVNSDITLSNGKHSVSYTSYAKPLTNMEGYMPHFFHDFMIIRKGEDGKAEVVGSATSLDKAVAKAEEMHSKNGGDFLISPKAFQFDGEIENPVLMADKDYRKLMNNITMNSTMSLEDAKAVTQARMKGRHAFLGELKKRKGAEGFEDNAIWAIQHHIDASARYCALDPFKTKAINLFERAYGDSQKDYGRLTMQGFAKGYIESMMGKPTEGELFVNKILRYIPGLKNSNRPARLLTGMLAHTVGVLKLGASPAAGFVNLMQIFNANGYLGSRRVAVGIKRAMHPTMADLRILKSLGVDEEVGLADSDFGKVRLEDSRLGRIADRYTKLADKLMLPFSTAEKTIRRATVLAAYYKYMEEHAGETDAATLRKRAGNYAMEINRKVNFDYSVADAPRIFRAVQGTVIGDLALQFQKYGVKELEVIGDFLPYFGKNTTAKQKLEFFGYYLAVAGMWNAFPFQDLLMSILGWMFDDDPEKMAKKAMMEWAGNDPMCKALVNVANYGAGSLVGMDISQRVGLKGVVPEVSGGGPLASTTIGLAKAIINGDTNGAMKSISPALGNIYGAIAGYNTDSKGRKTVDYGDWGTADGAWNRAMRGLGFRTVKEATATDAQNIIYNYKDQKKSSRDKAKAEYFKNPSSENIKKLKDLGYTDKQIKNLKDNKNSTRVERAQSGLSKDDMKKLKPVFDYAN